MLLLFPLMFLASLLAAVIPVKHWPPGGRRCLLLVDLALVMLYLVISRQPPTYSEWGMGDLAQQLALYAAVLLALSALPLAFRCFVRPRP